MLRKVAFIILLSTTVLFSTAVLCRAAPPNLSGRWLGTAQRQTTERSSGAAPETSRQRGFANVNLLMNPDQLWAPAAGAHTLKASGNKTVRVKIYHEDNQVQIEAETPFSAELLPYLSRPAHFLLAIAQSLKHPVLSKQIAVKLGSKGIVVHDRASGKVAGGKTSLDITIDSSLTRATNLTPENDSLHCEIKLNVKATTRTDQGRSETQTQAATWIINFHREFSEPEKNWSDKELTCLLTGAERYPFTSMATFTPPGNKPLGEVARFAFGNKEAGYRRLFNYALKQYRLSTPKPCSFELESDSLYGSYNRLTGSLKIYRHAFSWNILFLASSYVHEYSHYLQHTSDPDTSLINPALNKNQRETEAHCIQIEWLKRHPALPGDLRCPKNKLCEMLADVFQENYKTELVCHNGELPRNWVRAQIAALSKGGGNRGELKAAQPFVKKSFSDPTPARNQWQDVVK